MTTNNIKISNIIDARRMDPIYFRFGTEKYGVNYKLATIGSVCCCFQSGFGAGKGDQASKEDGILHLRPTNMDTNSNLIYDKNIYVPSNLNRPTLQFEDVLFNNTNSQELVGKTAIYNKEEAIFFSNHITRIRVNRDYVLPKYLQIVLNKYQSEKLFYSICTNWNNQSGVGVELLKSTKIPLPPIAIQQKVVATYQKAQDAKQAKEDKAKALLARIDKYVLSCMGINIQQNKDTTRFKICISEFIGKRHDPYYHNPYFSKAFKELACSTYPLMTIRDMSLVVTSGITPLSGGDSYTNKETGVAFIRSGNIRIDGNIDFDDLLYIKEDVHTTKMKSSQVHKNDIMIAIVGATIGQIGIYKSDQEANINQAIALVRLKDGYNYDFVKELIKSSIGQLNLNRLKRPVARANINLEEISSMELPIPPIEVQNQIANYIVDIRAKAKHLQQEGAELLKEAKDQIEKIILG